MLRNYYGWIGPFFVLEGFRGPISLVPEHVGFTPVDTQRQTKFALFFAHLACHLHKKGQVMQIPLFILRRQYLHIGEEVFPGFFEAVHDLADLLVVGHQPLRRSRRRTSHGRGRNRGWGWWWRDNSPDLGLPALVLPLPRPPAPLSLGPGDPGVELSRTKRKKTSAKNKGKLRGKTIC